MEFKETMVIDVGEEKIDGLAQLTLTFEYTHSEDGFEFYNIIYKEYNTIDTFRIAEWAMDISREIETEDNGPVLEFLWLMYTKTLRADIEELETREFFEDISD